MAPFLVGFTLRDAASRATSVKSQFQEQWIRPGDVFTVLLVLGSDVILRAIAQLAGGCLTPITFSFGKAHKHRSSMGIAPNLLTPRLGRLLLAFGHLCSGRE
jgi:hypothetical protein